MITKVIRVYHTIKIDEDTKNSMIRELQRIGENINWNAAKNAIEDQLPEHWHCSITDAFDWTEHGN